MNNLDGLIFKTDLGYGAIEYIVIVDGNQITVDTKSKLGRNCVFNENYENFKLEQFVDDLHSQQLEDLSVYIWEHA